MKSLNQKDREGESKIERRLAELERQFLKVPSRWPQQPGQLLCEIIGGNQETSYIGGTLVGGVVIGGTPVVGPEQIAYVADQHFAVDKFYDAEVDTALICGLGIGLLIDEDGHQPTRVLIRHNCKAYSDPVPAGRRFPIDKKVKLTVASGPDAGKTMVAYTIRRG